ncbi:MAG TPA: hypothetical protein VF150_10685 [Thermoanaerobaculia bacterium]
MHRIVALAVGLGALAGCGGEEAEPVARLAADPMALTVAYGTYTGLGLTWQPTAELEGASGEARVFLHLLDDDGGLARTFDHDIPGGWRVGRESSYRVPVYQSLLAPPLPPGTYSLTAGLYDAEGNRWPLTFEGERTGRHEYRVATVEVPAQGAELPAVQFSPTWSPTLAGADRQVVAFRWLAGDGAIRLTDLPGPGTLWIALVIPGPGAGGLTRRMLPEAGGGSEGDAGEAEEGAEDEGEGAEAEGAAAETEAPGGEPRVSVEASCSGFTAQVSGEGRHDVEVPVTAGDAEEADCEVTLRPNYAMESPAGDEQTVLLEILAWKPAGG